ncbi:MAG: ABC transporter transmembrane domain-containing protein, partial [Alphaproteobacteria bacterium]|nr:ABC transporter transmembrane domain-containing protein [Alphaproteobacteria bacterium]
MPYLWPVGRPGLRLRVVVALCLLAAAKFANVYVPFLYKAAIDALSLENIALIVVPVGAIVGYGLARVLAQAFGELRDAVFIKVGQNAIRSVALQTFEQLHRLALRFHLERQTGGLSRSIERGTKGIQFLLTFSLFNILPTLFEILLVVGILLYNYTPWFGLLTLLTISGYIAFTLAITEWRTKFRRQMNDMDNEANTKAIDSLLNYETVKYFGNEGHEAERYDASLARYEQAAIRSQTTLSYLN